MSHVPWASPVKEGFFFWHSDSIKVEEVLQKISKDTFHYNFFCGTWNTIHVQRHILLPRQELPETLGTKYVHGWLDSDIPYLTFKLTRRYSSLGGLTSSSCGGLRPRLFLPFGQKKSLLCCFGSFLAIFGIQ